MLIQYTDFHRYFGIHLHGPMWQTNQSINEKTFTVHYKLQGNPRHKHTITNISVTMYYSVIAEFPATKCFIYRKFLLCIKQLKTVVHQNTDVAVGT